VTTSQGSDVGQEVDSQCLKCKDVTNHIIVALVEEKIAKVECKVCGAKHKLRPPKAAVKKAAKKKTAAPKAPKKTKAQLKAEAFFEEVMEGLDPSTAKPYSMTGLFRKDELIDHPTFGLGVITSVMLPNKITVTFKNGNKLLICKLKNPYES
jgi:hypothetical protein